MQFAWIVTFGARKHCPFFEINEDIDPLLSTVDPSFADEPRRTQTQHGLEELRLIIHQVGRGEAISLPTPSQKKSLTHSKLKRAN